MITALYVIPHQDDEILTTGAAIMADVAAGEVVGVLLVTDGAAIPVYDDLAVKLGFTPTKAEVVAHRDAEFTEGVTRMGGIPIIPHDRIPDGSTTGASVRALIEANGHSGLKLRGTAPTDYHKDHTAVGDAIVALASEEWGTDHRLMLSGERKVSHAPAGVIMQQMGSHGDISAYHQWPYKEFDPDNGWWGVAYLDIARSFDYAITSDGATYWYPPSDAP